MSRKNAFERREHDRHADREQELHGSDDRHQDQPDRDAVAVEQVHDAEGDETEDEAHCPGDDRRRRQDDLRELDLADQALPAGHRRGRVAQGGGEPLPGQDGREDEQRVVRCLAVEDDRHEDDVDGHLEQRVDDPPELPEQGVRVGPLDVGPDKVTGQSPTPEDLAEAGPDQREGVRAPAASSGRGDRLGGYGRHERP